MPGCVHRVRARFLPGAQRGFHEQGDLPTQERRYWRVSIYVRLTGLCCAPLPFREDVVDRHRTARTQPQAKVPRIEVGPPIRHTRPIVEARDERTMGWFYTIFRPMPKPPDDLRAGAARLTLPASNEWRVERFGAKVG